MSEPRQATISLNEKEHVLKFSTASFALAEEKHGRVISYEDIVGLEKGQLGKFPLILWLGLLAKNPTLKYTQLLEWLAGADNEGEIMAACVGAISAFAEQMEKLAPKEEKKRKKGKPASAG